MPNDDVNPYAAPEHGADQHPPSERSSGQVVYMGFWTRVVASILDTLILLPLGIPLGWVVVFSGGKTEEHGVLINVLGTIMAIVFILLFWMLKSATPGKMVFGARIVDARTLQKPTFGQYVVRYIGYFPAAFVFGLGFLWVAFDKKKRGWHDLMADTVVVVPAPFNAPPSSIARPSRPPASSTHET